MKQVLLEKQYDFYVTHEKELLEKFLGKHLVISDKMDVVAFDSGKEACKYGVKVYGDGNFMLHKCVPGSLDVVHMVNCFF